MHVLADADLREAAGIALQGRQGEVLAWIAQAVLRVPCEARWLLLLLLLLWLALLVLFLLM